jgi:hypothetical protein
VSTAGIRRLGLAPDRDLLYAQLADAVRQAAAGTRSDVHEGDDPAAAEACDATLILGTPGRHTHLLDGTRPSVLSRP